MIRLVLISTVVFLLNACVMFKSDAPRSVKMLSGLNEFPVGLWVATVRGRSEIFEQNGFFDVAKIKLHIHSIGAMWGEISGPGEQYCAGEFESDTRYTMDLDDFTGCVSLSSWEFRVHSSSLIRATSPNGEQLSFKRINPPEMPSSNFMMGIWEQNVDEQAFPLSIRENYIVSVVIDEWVERFRLYHDDAGILLLNTEPGEEMIYQPISTIEPNRISLISSGGLIEYIRTKKDLGAQLIVDDYGRPLEINQVAVSINVFGNIAETILDIRFTNINPEAEEAQFTLPIPSNAVVTGYALDVDGVMVSGVAILKEEAQEAFEILQHRGIDPGLAKMSESNQFSTEVYPIQYRQQRRIQVAYLETLDTAIGKSEFTHYSFPIQKFGKAGSFQINLNIQTDSPPTIDAPQDEVDSELSDSCGGTECNYTGLLSYDNFEFEKPITIDIPKNELSTKIFQSPSGILHYVVLGQSRKNAKKDKYKNIEIYWDNSFSMFDYHDDYVRLVQQVRKEYPKTSLNIVPFNLDQGEAIQLNPRWSKNDVKKALSKLRYDGATNFNILNRMRSGSDELNILFSDGINTSAERYHFDSLRKIVVVYPKEAAVNLPLLNRAGQLGGVFALARDDSKEIVAEIDNDILPVKIDAAVGEVILRQPTLPSAQFRILGKLKIEELPKQLNVNIGGEIRTINLAESDIENSTIGEKLWAAELLAPMLSAPRNNKEEIEEIGKNYGLSTPYTTLIVLEDLDEYVEFGIKPPGVMDPESRYDSLRKHTLQRQMEEQNKRLEELASAWSDRLHWWKTGQVRQKRYDFNWLLSDGQNCDVNNSCVVEEVLVAGVRSSLVPSIHIEPWNPDAPYLTVIRSAEQSQWLEIYDKERKNYVNSMPFYMDMAKFFFDNGRLEDGNRILSNIMEIFPGKARMERLVAYILLENNLDELALPILEHLNEIVPYQASSKRDLAMLYEKLGQKNSNDEYLSKALKLYYHAAINSSDAPNELPVTALMEMNRLLTRIGNSADTSWIDKKYLGEMDLDLRITLSWTNEFSMVDLYVTEPSGEVVEWKDRISKIGAWLPYDSWSNGPVEYLLRDAVSGDYDAKAVYWSDDDIEGFSPIGVRVDFYINYGRKNEKHVTSVIRLEQVNEEYVVGKVFIPKLKP